jgi:ABC-type branched-subunit amino acid transport system ATPase component
MNVQVERRSRSPYDVLLRAFLHARSWRGGRRALIDALPECGRLAGPVELMRTLSRIGFRCAWTVDVADRVRAKDLPTIALSPHGPLLLKRCDEAGQLFCVSPSDRGTERHLHAFTPLLVLQIVDVTMDRRTSIFCVAMGESRALAAIAALCPAPIGFALCAPALCREMAAGAPGALGALAGLGLAAMVGHVGRDAVLSGTSARIEARLTALSAESALLAPLGQTPARPERFGAIPRLVASGAAGAALDVGSAIAACIGALAIGGLAAAAPPFALLALSLVFSTSRLGSRDLARSDIADQDERSFRRADRTSGLLVIARTVLALCGAALFVLWAVDRASFADLVGLAFALHLASTPLLSLIGADQDVADGEQALTRVRALERQPSETPRPQRMSLHGAADIRIETLGIDAPSAAEGPARIASLRIAPGEDVAFVGGRSSGAETALSAICGLAPIAEGRILVNGRDLTRTDLVAYRAEIAWASGDLVFPPMSAFALVRRLAPFADEATARAVFDQIFPASLGVGHDDLLTHDAPRELRLRLSLAGAIARRAPLLAVALGDDVVAPDILDLLTTLAGALRARTTILVAGADPALLRLADRVIGFDRGRTAPVRIDAVPKVEHLPPQRRFAATRVA